MAYSMAGALAAMVHCIININILRRGGGAHLPAQDDYRRFLFSVIAYHVTDALWGVFYAGGIAPLLYADTVLYFAAMALSVLLWTTFVIRYLGTDSLIGKREGKFALALHCAGQGFFVFQMAALVVNFFHPIFFSVYPNGAYRAEPVRYAAFTLQMLMFLMTSIYTFSVSDKATGFMNHRHFSIGLFGFTMIFSIAIQLYFPLLPMYSAGCLLGCCILHVFVVEDEKEEYLLALEESLNREVCQERELGVTKHLAYTDPLTGVKSKRAYMQAAESMNRRIIAKQSLKFAVVVFDVNGLKHINDTLGHKAGDRYIISASELICDVFKHSPIFRIGGDEFSAILEGKDYENRAALMTAFDGLIEHNLCNGQVVVSAGISEFDPEHDETFQTVFQRADEKMYQRKRFLKEQGACVRE